ncbi:MULTISPECIES: sigma-70 family RNA polymerase sigma factor [Methylobacterium]|uniref:RNA polymerase sigma factor n=2 Tax=Methylobacterium TaxID=407 RepID=A0A0C6F3G8_9HYPH|nr:sigma-70 family RNA polymerase sigma factor [Methylobacterium aquaticum]BAQ47181.1 ECF subfamily RNA polymerase sigma-24 factor [Methylobacterium aquaticum]
MTREPDVAPDAALALMQSHLGRQLRQYYPEIVAVEAGSRLGDVLARLTRALQTAEAGREVSAAFKDELLGAVPRLRRYALSLAQHGADADDLVQHTLLKAWEHRRQFVPGTSLSAWLFTILRNGFFNGRRRHRLEVADPDGVHSATLTSDAVQEHRADLRDLQDALDRLEPSQREALLLVGVEGLTYEAAAVVIGCPPGTVKSRVSRARDRLAQELGHA